MKQFLIGALALAAGTFAANASGLPAYGTMPQSDSYITKTLSEVAPLATAEDIPYYHAFDNANSLDGFTPLKEGSRGWVYNEIINQDTKEIAYCGACSKDPYFYDKNDLLITPAIKVEAGKNYNVKIRTASGNGRLEKLSIYGGKTKTMEGMTDVIYPETTVSTNSCFLKDALTLEGDFKAKESGEYYIGMWCKTQSGATGDLYIFDISISERATSSDPATPSNFEVTPDPDGKLSVTVKCKAPTKTVGGEDLAGLSAVEFLCDNKVIYTKTGPALGADLTFKHDPAVQGAHSYGVVAVANNGKRSDVVDRTVFVGVAQPLPVSDVLASETETAGTVKITWTAPTEDLEGKALKPELLSYKVISYIDNTRVEKDITVEGKNEATFVVSEPDAPQSFRTFGVIATTTGGAAEEVKSDAVAVGKADVLPYRESFANGEPSHPFMNITRMYTTSWNLVNAKDQAQDGDNGYVRFYATGVNGIADLLTGKIDLGAETNPILSFWLSGISPNNPNTLEVLVDAGEGYETIGEEYVASTSDWTPISVDLSKFAGKKIQIAFRGTCRQSPYMALDNIRIGGAFDKDLTIVRYDVPVSIDILETEPLTFTVGNVGKQTSDAYKITLYCNDKEIATQDGPALEPGKEYDFEFEITPAVNSYDVQTYRAQVIWDADENPGNNSTPRFPINIVKPELKNVQNVKIERNDANHNVLTWETPEGASFDSENPYHKLKGYQLFRDGKALTSSMLTENKYEDTIEPANDTKYTFITHYEAGQSVESNEYMYIAGIEAIMSGTPVVATKGAIMVGEGVSAQVYDLNGAMIANVKGAVTIDILPGMYLVRANGKTMKVVVK